ncbi:MAG: sodium:solute symporter family protein [Bacillota bacterium]
MNVYIGTLFLYFAVMLLIGYLATKRIKTFDDFALMGRRAAPWLVVATISASWYGAGTVTGLPSTVFKSGFTPAFGWMLGASLGFILVIKLAPRVARTRLRTIPDILEARYGLAARYLGMIGLLGTWSTYIGYQIIAVGWVLDVGAGIPPRPWGFLLGFGIVFLYTIAGGLYSVVWTDFIQSLIMFVGLTLAIPFGLKALGGVVPAVEAISQAGGPAMLTPFGAGFLVFLGWALQLGGLAIVDPTTAQRLLAVGSPRKAQQAAYGAVFMPFFFYSAVPLLAMFTRVLYPEIPNAEYSLLYLAKYMLPVVVGAPLLAAVVATIMSTADSALNICSTLIVNDVYKRLINPNASERQLVFWGRVFVAVWAVYGLVLAFALPGVLAGLKIAYTIMAGVVMPSWVAAFLWRRATGAGAVAAMALSLVTVIWWNFWPPYPISAVIPTMAMSVLALVAVSLLTKPPAPEQLELFKVPREGNLAVKEG